MLFLVFCLLSFTQCMAQEQGVLAKMSTIERCLLIIRHWEQWHDNPRDAEYIGWGHRIQPHERHLNQNITRAQGDSLLYEDLRKLIIHYKRYGKDAALLSCLAYQVGVRKVDGNRTRPPSRLIQKIRTCKKRSKATH